MNRIFKIFIAVCVLLVGLSMNAAAENTVPYASEAISDTGIGISVSGGRVYASATVSATSKASKLGFTKIILYHKIDGNWEVAASASDKYGYNLKSFGASVSCEKSPGREYKATCSSMATVDGVSDTGSASVGPVTIN